MVENKENGGAEEEMADKSALNKSSLDTTLKIERPDYEELVTMLNIVSKPLASKKMTKKIYKLVKKCAKAKQLRRGVKDVSKALRKKEKGVIFFAGDVSPLDVYSHMPLICEENKIPYCFVPARIDLGLASQTKRACCVVMAKKGAEYADSYAEIKEAVKSMPLPL